PRRALPLLAQPDLHRTLRDLPGLRGARRQPVAARAARTAPRGHALRRGRARGAVPRAQVRRHVHDVPLEREALAVSGPEAEFWDRVYAGEDYRFGREPNAFLAE